MPTIHDLLPADARAKYPLDVLNRRGRALFSSPVPPDADPAQVSDLVSALVPGLPKMTVVASAARRVRRAQRPGMVSASEGPWPGARVGRVEDPAYAAQMRADLAADFADHQPVATQEAYGRLPVAGKVGARVAAALARAASLRGLPFVGDAFPRTDNLVPEARGKLEHAADIAGGVAGFTAVAAPATAAAVAGGVPAVGAGAIGAGVAAMAPEGSMVQRGIRGLVTAPLALVGGVVGNRVGSSVAKSASRMRLPNAAARLIANRGVARLVPYGAADRMLALATPEMAGDIAGRVSGGAASALSFGAGVPVVENLAERGVSRLTGGEAPPPITFDDVIRSTGEMAVIEALSGVAHARGGPKRVVSRREGVQPRGQRAVEVQRGFNTGGGTRFRARWLRSQEAPASEPTGAPAQPAHEAAAPVEAARPPAPQMPGKTTPWRVERVPGEKPDTGDVGAAGVPDEIRDALRKIHATEALSDKYKRDLVPHERRLIDRHYTRIREWATQNEPYRSEVLRADRLRAKAQRESNPNRRAELLRRADAAEYRVQRSIESGSRMVDVQRAKDVAGQNIDLRETRPERQLPAHEGLPREPGRNRRPAPVRKQLPDAGLARGEALPAGPEGFYPRALLTEGKKSSSLIDRAESVRHIKPLRKGLVGEEAKAELKRQAKDFDDRREARVAAYRAVVAEHDKPFVEFVGYGPHESDRLYVLHRNVGFPHDKDMPAGGKGSPWRVTRYDRSGPTGHDVYKSLDEALTELAIDGVVTGKTDPGRLDRWSQSSEWAEGVDRLAQVARENRSRMNPPTEEPPPVAAKPEPPGPKPAPAEVRVSGRSEVGAVESPAKPPPGESAPGTPKKSAGSRGRRSGAPAEAVEPSTAAAPPAVESKPASTRKPKVAKAEPVAEANPEPRVDERSPKEIESARERGRKAIPLGDVRATTPKEFDPGVGRDALRRWSPDGKVWTNGHFLIYRDALKDPKRASHFGPDWPAKDDEYLSKNSYPRYEQVIPKDSKDRVEVEPVGGAEENQGVGHKATLVRKGTDEPVATVNAGMLNLIRNELGDGVRLLANPANPLGPIVLKKNGKTAGLLMPLRQDTHPDVATMRATVEHATSPIGRGEAAVKKLYIDLLGEVFGKHRNFAEMPPEEMPSGPLHPDAIRHSLGRAAYRVAWGRETHDRLKAALVANPKDANARTAAALLKDELKLSAEVAKAYSAKAVGKRLQGLHGEGLQAELAKIKSEVNAKLGPEGPADWGGAMSFAGTGEIGRALGHLALRQIPRALENLRRTLGRRATTVRLMDGHGNVTDRFDMMEHIFDPYSDFATMRMGAHMRVLGGDTVLPPNLVNHERRASVRREQFVSEWSHRYREEFGDDILQWIGKNKQRANRIAEGLEAPKTPAEKAFKAASKRITDALHAELVAHATRLGLEVPGYRENFVPRFLNGEGETHLRELTAIIDKGLQGKDLEDRLAALTHRRTGDDAYIENYPDNLRRYINYVGRRISHDEFFREVSRYVETDPEVKRGGARGDLVKDWFKSNYLKRRSSFEEAWDDGLRAMAFNRRAKRITENDIPTAAKWLGVSERDLIEKIANAAPDWVRATTTKGAKNEFAGFTQPKVVIVPKGEKDIRFIAGGQRLPDSVMNRMMERGMTEDQIRAAEGQPITVHLGDWGPGHEAYAVLLGKAVDAAPREFKPQTMAAMRAREAVVRGGRRAGRAIRGIRWDEKLERRLSEESIQETAMRAWENPFEALAHFWTGNIQRAVMGLNLRTAYNNAFNALITSMPEYGLRDFSKAVVRASSATGRAGALKLVRGLIEAQRRRGTIPSASLSGLEAKLAPRLLDEILAHAAGAEQGESYRHQHELKKVAAGRVGLGSRLFDLTDPMVPQQAAEGMNRMLDAIGAEIHAARIGLSEGRLAKFRTQILRAGARSRARLMRDLADDIIDPGTRLSYIAAMDDLTQYNYGPRSRMWMMGGGVGRMVSQLSTWPLNNAFKQVLRPAEGALRVAGASARGVADVTRLVGKAKPASALHVSEQIARRGFIDRSRYPTSKNWVSRWLSAYGANQAHQDAAAHFVRALVLSSFMVGGSIVSGVNFGVAGVNPLFAGVVKLLKAMGLKGDRMKAWLMSHNAPERVQRLGDIDAWDKYATEGSTMSFMRGYGTKLGVLPVSPPTLTILSDLWDEVSANAQAGASEDPAKRAALERKRRIGAAAGGAAGLAVGSMLGARGALAGAATGALVGYAAFSTALGIVRQQLSGWIARTTHLPVGEVAVRRAVAGAPAVRAELERNETARTLTGMRSTMEYENARDWLLDQVGLLSIEKKNAARRKIGGRAAARRVALPDFPAYPEMPAYPEPAR